MSITLSALQKQRRDTAANWTAENPTLLAGEIGIESDTGKIKIGNGSTAWASLGYQGIIPSSGAYPLNQLLMPSGTVSAPSISFDGDTNLGIYRSGTDQLSFTTAGTERLRIDAAGQIEAVSLGTAAAPTFSFTGDPNTGIYSPGADQVAISTNGTGRLFIDASGNVGVGGSPQATLSVFGNTRVETGFLQLRTNNKLYLNDAGNTNFGAISNNGTGSNITFETAATERMRLDSSGRLGLGTSSPGFKLTIEDATTPRIRIGDGTRHLNVDGGSTTQNAAIGTDYAGSFGIYTNGAANTRLHVTSAGNVGIGTTSPADTFDCRGDGRVQAGNVRFMIRPSGGTSGWLQFSEDGVADRWSVGIANGDSSLIFKTGGSFSGTERCRLDGSGRLLVGTSSTSANTRLLVAGGPGSSNGSIRLATSSTTPASGETLSNVSFANNAATHATVSDIVCARDGGTWTNGTSHPTRLEFSTTADGASSPTERMRITQGGSVCIGSANTQTSRLSLEGSSANLYNAVFHDTRTGSISAEQVQFKRNTAIVGNISTTDVATAYNTSSDYRLKENVVSVTDGITRLQQLKPSRFNFIANPDKTVDGFIAHEVQAIVPEAITGEKDAVDDEGNPQYQGIDQSKLVPLLTAALQEAIGRIETLEAEVAALKAQ
jgi:hypothetical protein